MLNVAISILARTVERWRWNRTWIERKISNSYFAAHFHLTAKCESILCSTPSKNWWNKMWNWLHPKIFDTFLHSSAIRRRHSLPYNISFPFLYLKWRKKMEDKSVLFLLSRRLLFSVCSAMAAATPIHASAQAHTLARVPMLMHNLFRENIYAVH